MNVPVKVLYVYKMVQVLPWMCVCVYMFIWSRERERIIFPSDKVEKKNRAEIPFLTMLKDRASTL